MAQAVRIIQVRLPADLGRELERRAAIHRASLNSTIVDLVRLGLECPRPPARVESPGQKLRV